MFKMALSVGFELYDSSKFQGNVPDRRVKYLIREDFDFYSKPRLRTLLTTTQTNTLLYVH